MNITEEKFEELQSFYESIDIIEDKFKIHRDNFTDENIEDMFNQHCEEYSVEIGIKDLFDNYNNQKLYINSFDGYNEILNLYEKSEKDIYHIKSNFGEIKCADKHKLEAPEGFKFAKDFKMGEKILIDSNEIDYIKFTEKVSREKVYDFKIDHPNHRYFAGRFSNHNSGKTFLALNIAREALKQGYKLIWIDTENAMDDLTFQRFGIDIDQGNVIRVPIDIIENVTSYITNLAEALLDAKSGENEVDKYLIVIDSLGQLSTLKETADALSGSEKADMTRAKQIKKLFRVCTKRLGQLKIPVVITNHIYASIGFIPKPIQGGGSGGKYSASTTIFLTKAQLKEDGKDKPKTGALITATIDKSRFTRGGMKVKFHISFYKGMNPFVGLEEYIGWEECGIDYGKYVKGVYTPSSQARTLAVKHMDKHIPAKQLWTPGVFTEEVLKNLEPRIRVLFELPPINQIDYDLIELLTDGEDDEYDEETGELIVE